MRWALHSSGDHFVKLILTVTVSALVLAPLPAPAVAQHQDMPGMTMPAPARPAAKKKPAAKKEAVKKSSTAKPKSSAAHGGHERTPASGSMTQPTMTMPLEHGQMQTREHAGRAMTGALGPYPMERESSGTAWQPDTSEHMGLMKQSGDWTLMAHGVLNLVFDHQSGPRGDDKPFASGMLMGVARRPLGNGTVQLKAMVSPDPLMGPRGYPLLLASGETANGRDRLTDRQHPHDFFMELSASASQNIGPNSSVFLYAALPGEPAFGPPAFMHREAILDSPEAPITHHWLDSTHISFGVLTAGLVIDRARVEVSRFNGREPDQHRWNIETGPLDSTAVRLSWNPVRTLALQASWGHFTDPEQLEPGSRPDTVVGERAVGERDCARLEARRHARVGQEVRARPQRRCAGRRSLAQACPMEPVRAGRDDPKPRADRGRQWPRLPGGQGLTRGGPRLQDRGACLGRRGRPVLGQLRARCARASLWRAQSRRRDGIRKDQAGLRRG